MTDIIFKTLDLLNEAISSKKSDRRELIENFIKPAIEDMIKVHEDYLQSLLRRPTRTNVSVKYYLSILRSMRSHCTVSKSLSLSPLPRRSIQCTYNRVNTFFNTLFE
jgi:hypothetical protein